MSCISCICKVFKGSEKTRSQGNTRQNYFTVVNRPRPAPEAPRSASDATKADGPEAHQFLRRHTTTTSTSSIIPVSERNRRYTNESLSSLARSTGTRKVRRVNRNDSLPSQIIAFRTQFRRRTNSSDDMSGGNDKPIRGRRRAMPSLRNELKAEMVLKNHPDLHFLPVSALNKVLHETAIAQALERHKHHFNEDASSLELFVLQNKKVFAILAWAESEHKVEEFFQEEFTDAQLPVQLVINRHDLVEAISIQLKRISLKKHPFNNEHWTDRNIEAFRDHYQWPFLSPVFEESLFRYDFNERTRMPFVDEYPRSLKESFFSVVEELRLHRDHILAPNLIRIPERTEDHPTVAVKTLKPTGLDEAKFKTLVTAEVDALEAIRDLKHRHLVKAVAYYTKGKTHCIVFPWARWGNLRDFWAKYPPKLNRKFLKWVFAQLGGLAEATKTLHHSHKERSVRHGDLKPENILCFDDPTKKLNDNVDSCILVIADVGLSRTHDEVTELRKGATRTKSGTIMYEPPETELQPDEPRSRRYDVWSLGCIYLEFLIWLLYGPKELEHFRDDLSTKAENARFYVIRDDPDTRKKTARLNGDVSKWVDYIKMDERCQKSTAVGKLLDLVVERLLIADVGPVRPFLSRRATTFSENGVSLPSSALPTPSVVVRQATFDDSVINDTETQTRATAEELDEELKLIFKNATSTTAARVEWINWSAPAKEGPKQYGKHLDTSKSARNVQSEYRFTPLNNDWKYAPDDEMARELFTLPQTLFANVKGRGSLSRLCQRCNDLPIWLPRHEFSDTVSDLKAKSAQCDLCRLLKKHTLDQSVGDDDAVQFFRVGSSLTLYNRQSAPSISLYVSSKQDPLGVGDSTIDLQLGLPHLHEPGTSAHVKVLSKWISSCDTNHQCSPKSDNFLPTRVLQLGEDPTTVRLLCSPQGQTRPGRYIALSHRWGSSLHHQDFFCTCRHNIIQHQQGMNVANFPKTFQDAVKVTRALGVPYLWIDSLCIVQDDRDDWNMESKLMEQVFSNAYVTIAASCATGTHDGFLKLRPPRECVTIRKGDNSTVYLCDAIDDFTGDVEDGQLNKRGWVLQERALSRRTIYFAERQTYWECGHGVRCETFTKMNNKKASFLGDASFPDSIESYVKGTRIELFQSLFKRYSTLELSYPVDRPVAIRGLERRLLRTLKTDGGHGIFEIYLHRSLLWQRSGSSVRRIKQLFSQDTPSWSWLAYEGSIEYMNVPFGDVAWTKDIQSPWTKVRSQLGTCCEINEWQKPQNHCIWAQAWELTSSCKPTDMVLDDPSNFPSQSLRLVIVGTRKTRELSITHPIIYGLIVTKKTGSKHEEYERVGVAALEDSMICRNKPSMAIQLV